MFGVSPLRLTLYGLAIVALIAANLWRLGQVEGPAPTAVEAPVLTSLPDLSHSAPTDAAPLARDLFRKPAVEAEAPPSPPPQPPQEPVRAAPQFDEMAARIEMAEAALDAYRVVGILRVGADMVATLARGGGVVTVKEGGVLPEGFVARRVAIDHIILAHEGLGIERRFQAGVPDGG